MQLRLDPASLTDQYQAAEPFPHIVMDGLFEGQSLERVLSAFPQPQDPAWRRFENDKERKLGFDYRMPIAAELRAFLDQLNSAPVLEFLEALTGIDGLIPDPYFGGAGPHQLLPGGFLKIHADFNWHPKLRLDRRLNLLVYLNRDWQPEYGGQLELWDGEMQQCVESVVPVFNRTVVFNTTSTSYHGNPTPVACPQGNTRKSIAMYYYTVGRPEEEQRAPHDTLFVEPGQA